MHPMTEANLHNAYTGESMAHMRYLIFAARAEKDGFKNTARLLRAVAFAEQVHATNHFARMPRTAAPMSGEAPFGLGTTSQNLQYAIDGETFEINEMYPVFKETAIFQGEKAVVTSFDWALQTEKVHQKLFTDAKTSVDQGKDWKPAKVQICETCGYTIEGDAPDKCPICGAKKESFREFA
jgi:rubrerythrin